MMDDPWEDRAACKEFPDTADRQWWFPDGDSEKKMDHGWREVCAGCPVLAQCKRYVMSLTRGQDISGNIAGMTLAERRRLRRTGSVAKPKRPHAGKRQPDRKQRDQAS